MTSFRSLRPRRVVLAGLAVTLLAASAVLAAATPLRALGTVAPAADTSFATTRNGVRCTGPATTAARSLALRVQNRVGPALRATRVRIAFAADDTATGIRCTTRATDRFDSASVVKVAIVAALLDRRRAAHHSLSRTERAWARAAITRSDNRAASATGMRRFFAKAGMTQTVPGRGGVWGLTRVTARDQLTLLRRVTRPALLASADRSYLQGLMASVVRGQRWGVPVGAPPSARVGNKNGWLHRSARGWRVHSVGWVRLRTTTYDVVLLSDGNGSLSGGTARLDRVARAVHVALGGRR
jgi:beta-lactamase class A